MTDQPERFLVAELIREQVLLITEQEVPYATTVLIEQYEESARLTRIAATIYCERDGQKAILIGKQGATLKKIGTAARLQIEKLLNTKVFLELFVKVKAGWRDSRQFVQETDWRTQLERMSEKECRRRTQTPIRKNRRSAFGRRSLPSIGQTSFDVPLRSRPRTAGYQRSHGVGKDATTLSTPIQFDSMKEGGGKGVTGSDRVCHFDFPAGNFGVFAVFVNAAPTLAQSHADRLAIVLIAPSLAEMLNRRFKSLGSQRGVEKLCFTVA